MPTEKPGQEGNLGIGYGFDGHVNTDIQAAAQGVNGSTYLRIPFEFTQQQKDAMEGLQLNVKYDDAFVAYLWFENLNLPTEIARVNAPGTGAAFPIRILAHDEVASSDRDAAAASAFEAIDVSNRRQYLRVGTNYLIIQLLNDSAASDDLLFDVEVAYITESIALPDNVIEYTDPITITGNTVISTRNYDAATDEWSARAQASFFTSLPPIVISELNYNPSAPTEDEVAAGFIDNDEFEFIEFANVGSEAFDLNGARISDGITFRFRDSTILDAGERGVVVRNQEAFEQRYGTEINILGSWADSVDPIFSAKLNNDGERLVLDGPAGEPLMDFSYNDVWHPLTDGEGYTLTIVDPSASQETWGDAASWRCERSTRRNSRQQ